MNEPQAMKASTNPGTLVWTGRVISLLLVLLFAFSGVMKLRGGPELTEGFAHLGLPISIRVPLAILEITCAVIYAIPRTIVLGAILLTGYIGGAICTHWRVGDNFVLHIVIGALIWLGPFLQDERLRSLIPIVDHSRRTLAVTPPDRSSRGGRIRSTDRTSPHQ